jgi:hypothetical protein
MQIGMPLHKTSHQTVGHAFERRSRRTVVLAITLHRTQRAAGKAVEEDP